MWGNSVRRMAISRHSKQVCAEGRLRQVGALFRSQYKLQRILVGVAAEQCA